MTWIFFFFFLKTWLAEICKADPRVLKIWRIFAQPTSYSSPLGILDFWQKWLGRTSLLWLLLWLFIRPRRTLSLSLSLRRHGKRSRGWSDCDDRSDITTVTVRSVFTRIFTAVRYLKKSKNQHQNINQNCWIIWTRRMLRYATLRIFTEKKTRKFSMKFLLFAFRAKETKKRCHLTLQHKWGQFMS
jgi:hypothetical protein